MSRPKIGYPFKPMPHPLPAAWQQLSQLKRSILQDLWRLSDNGVLQVSGDAPQFLTMQLQLRVKWDRANSVRAIGELVRDGLIGVNEDCATVHTTLIVRSQSGDSPAIVRSQYDDSTQPKPSESLHVEKQIRVEEIREEEVFERACASAPAREAIVLPLDVQPACEVKTAAATEPISLERTLAAKGSDRLRRIGLEFFHLGSHQPFLAEIARKPEAEWKPIAELLHSEVMGGKRKFLTPRHIVDSWQLYAAGDIPGPKSLALVRPGDFVPDYLRRSL